MKTEGSGPPPRHEAAKQSLSLPRVRKKAQASGASCLGSWGSRGQPDAAGSLQGCHEKMFTVIQESCLQRSGCHTCWGGSGRREEREEVKAASAAQNTVLQEVQARISKSAKERKQSQEWAKVFIQVSRGTKARGQLPNPRQCPQNSSTSREPVQLTSSYSMQKALINVLSCVFVFWFLFLHKSTPNLSPLLILSALFFYEIC